MESREKMNAWLTLYCLLLVLIHIGMVIRVAVFIIGILGISAKINNQRGEKWNLYNQFAS